MARSKEKNITIFRVINNKVLLGDKETIMYGIEGVCGDEHISVSSLTDDYARIERLVDNLNRGKFELCHLKDIVDDFLYESYGIFIK